MKTYLLGTAFMAIVLLYSCAVNFMLEPWNWIIANVGLVALVWMMYLVHMWTREVDRVPDMR